ERSDYPCNLPYNDQPWCGKEAFFPKNFIFFPRPGEPNHQGCGGTDPDRLHGANSIMTEIRTDKRGSLETSPGSSPPRTLPTSRGRALPLGATALAEGINFALLCRHGTFVQLVIF